MDSNFFDYTLNFNWDMLPVDRSFDPIKVQEYLSLMNEPDSSFIQELLSKTTYIRYEEFKQALFQSFDLFRKSIGQEGFYLMLPSDKIGSEHWITALLWPSLRTMNLAQVIDEKSPIILNGITNILFIDDAIYSGQNTINKINAITFNGAVINKEINFMEIGKYLKFHVVTPFITTYGTNVILNVCKERNTQCIIYGIYQLPTLPNLMNINKYYSGNNKSLLSERFNIFSIDMPAVYFDHKVAGPVSTFVNIYINGRLPNGTSFGSLLKVNTSRYKIEELANLYKDWLNF